MPGDHEYRALLPARVLVDGDLGLDDATPNRTPRDWCVDTAAFLVAVLLGGLEWLNAVGRHGGAVTPWLAADLLAGVVSCLALWGRRRWPLALAVAMIPVGTVSGAAAGASAVALFNLAVRRPFRVVALVTVPTAATVPLYVWLHPDDLPAWVSMVISLLIIVVVVVWGMFVRARRQLVRSLAERTRRVVAEHELRVAQARHQERTRIAREMHDVLGHRLSLLSLHAGALEFRSDAASPEVVEAAAVIRASAADALADLRAVIGVLRADAEPAAGDDPLALPAPEPPQPTLDDLEDLVGECRRAGARIDLDAALPAAVAVPPVLGRTAYRIVQEGLTNARKHAPGARVTVAVDVEPGRALTVTVVNPLPVSVSAGPLLPGSGAGLIGLEERVTLTGGRLEHGPDADATYRLRAWLPWPA